MTTIHRINGLRTFDDAFADLAAGLLKASEIDAMQVHSTSIADKPEMTPRELLNQTLDFMRVPFLPEDWADEMKPNLPWAEDHFQERVSGTPLNPPPSAAWWPHKTDDHYDHVDATGRFSHTYPERFWPKLARYSGRTTTQVRQLSGIRFLYGDLMDVVRLMLQDSNTRQAYLPVWFPEDTGAGLDHRVPCTLGYHFICRNGAVSCTYYMRSCDFVRYLRDDVYMAGRLLQWVVGRLNQDGNRRPGPLTVHVVSLHAFRGDVPWLDAQASRSWVH